MPRNDLISFRKDKDAQFAAQLALQSLHASTQDDHSLEDTGALDRFRWYRAALRNKITSFRNDDSGEYHLVNQLLEEVESLEDLLSFRYILASDPIQRRDAIIDATKSIKRIQAMQKTLIDKGIYIWGQNNGAFDNINGPWGSPEYVDAYVSTMKRCKEGAELLDSDLFDADDPQTVKDFDELQKSPSYNKMAMLKKIDQKKTYLMSPDKFQEYLQSRKPVEKNNNIANEETSLLLKDEPDALYTVSKNRIKDTQNTVKDNIVYSLIGAFENPAQNGLAKSLTAFMNDLKKYHYEVQTKGDLADESMKYADSLLSLRHTKKTTIGNNERYDLQLNLNNPEEPKFLDKLISFIYNIEGCAEKNKNKKNIPEKEFDKIFTNDDGEGFRELLIDLKKFEKDPKIPAAFKAQCKMIQNKFENLVKQHVKNLDASDYEKYVIKNTGILNFDSGEALVDGVSKVTAAYEWKKNNERKPASQRESFNEEKVNALAVEMKKNPVFKSHYTKVENGKEKWSEVYLGSASKNSTEWKINNYIDNPFALADRGKKLHAVKLLQELAEILPKPTDGSADYERFNNKIRKTTMRDTKNLTDGDLNFILKDISEETEKYMKGRKSERYRDKSTEHFEEALDVLKIVSDISPYGAAFAKKLVDRTNYVRTHRWNGRTQKEVTLEGRSTKATQERIDILNGKKPAPAKNEGKTL